MALLLFESEGYHFENAVKCGLIEGVSVSLSHCGLSGERRKIQLISSVVRD